MASAWVHISGPNPKPASRRAQPRCTSASNPKPKYGSRPNGYLTPTLNPHLGEPSPQVLSRQKRLPSRLSPPRRPWVRISARSLREAPISADHAEKALRSHLGRDIEKALRFLQRPNLLGDLAGKFLWVYGWCTDNVSTLREVAQMQGSIIKTAGDLLGGNYII